MGQEEQLLQLLHASQAGQLARSEAEDQRHQSPSPQQNLQQQPDDADVDRRHAEAAAPGGALPDRPLPQGDVRPESVPLLRQLTGSRRHQIRKEEVREK